MNRILIKETTKYFIIFLFWFLFITPNLIYAEASPNFKHSLSVVSSKANYTTEEGYRYISCIGKIRNDSNKEWEDIVIEVQFFNTSNELIDTITENKYGIVAPANDEIAFRVMRGADKKEDEYVKHQVRITYAKEVTKCTSKGKSTFFKILVSCAPMLLLIAAWMFLAKKYQGKNSPQNKIIEIQEKQLQLIAEQNTIFREIANAIKNKNT